MATVKLEVAAGPLFSKPTTLTPPAEVVLAFRLRRLAEFLRAALLGSLLREYMGRVVGRWGVRERKLEERLSEQIRRPPANRIPRKPTGTQHHITPRPVSIIPHLGLMWHFLHVPNAFITSLDIKQSIKQPDTAARGI